MGAVALVALVGAAVLFLGPSAGSDPLPEHERTKVEPEALKSPDAPMPVVPSPGEGRENASGGGSHSEDGGDARAEGATAAEGTNQDDEEPVDPLPDVVADIELTVWPLGREGIQGAVGEVIPAIQRCYQDALTEIPDLAGKLSVSFEVGDVDGIGKVTDAWIEDDQLRDGPMSDCVEDSMRALQFDPPEGGGSMSVTYPIVFRPE